MTDLKIGDQVTRKLWLSRGNKVWYEIIAVTENQVKLKAPSGDTAWYPKSNDWVFKEKCPWLKIIPPQPEKRKLVPFELHGLSVSFGYKDEAGELACSAWVSAKRDLRWTKEELRSLGETLIEISKEMK